MGLLIPGFIGLIIGVLLYALTFYFSKEANEDKRKITVGIIGLICLIAGPFVIGGFSGIPISLAGAGIFIVAVLLWYSGEKPFWKKLSISIILMISLAGLLAVWVVEINGSSFSVDEKDDKLNPELEEYYEHLQENTDVKGYKTFGSIPDEKAVVLSLGEAKKGNSIEVLSVDNKSGRIIINVRTFNNQSSEENPTIIIRLPELQPNIDVKDTDGTLYEKAP